MEVCCRHHRIFTQFIVLFWLCLTGCIWTTANAASLHVPLKFDTPYLTSLLQQTLFAPPEGVSVWGDDSGCNDLTLSSPQAVIEDQRFYIITDASAQTGVQFGSRCVGLLRWSGKIKAEQRVDIIDPKGQIAFSTIDTQLLNSAGEPAKISNKFWGLAKQSVHPYLDQFRINLKGAVKEVQGLLPLFLQGDQLRRKLKMVQSVHLDDLAIGDTDILAAINFDIDIPQVEVKPVPQAALNEDETALFIRNWEQWDSFLVFIIKIAARDLLDTEQKEVLLDTLIQTRYDLVTVLGNRDTRSAEALRHSFVTTWQLLSPVFRSLSAQKEGGQSLRFLGFIAAADALEALGQLGPVIGWDISVDGLRRLARILIEDQNIDPLQAQPESDPEMRELFDFDRSLQLPAINQSDDLGQSTQPHSNLIGRVLQVLPPAAANITDQQQDLDLNRTAPTRENLEQYLPQVQRLLKAVSFGTLMTKPLDSTYRQLFHNLVLTTAWQETCWRQYRERSGKLTTMTSSAGALGMMQVMPRVWRGFYTKDGLANDIEYNAAAGTEILHRYLVRYALRKGEDKHDGGVENLARASYAAYNGGPKHLSRYRKGDTKAFLRKIDLGFWEKYQLIRDGDELAVKQCYPYF